MPPIGLVLLAVALPFSASPTANVAPCLWSAMPPFKEQVISAPDFQTFDQLRRQYPDADWTHARLREEAAQGPGAVLHPVRPHRPGPAAGRPGHLRHQPRRLAPRRDRLSQGEGGAGGKLNAQGKTVGCI